MKAMRAANRRLIHDDVARHRELDEAMELFQSAYRTLDDAARLLLSQRGLGRAHQRILYLIARSPGQCVSDMLESLQVTKQALNTPLNQLKRKGLVRSRRQPGNGRRKQLFLSPAGELLEAQLSSQHRHRLASALDRLGPSGERRWREVMRHLADGNQPWTSMKSASRRVGSSSWARRSRPMRAV